MNLLNSKSEYNQKSCIQRLVLPQTQSVEVNIGEGSQGVSNVGQECDTGAGNDRQDSEREGSDGVPGDGGGSSQTKLHHAKKRRRLDDNDNVGGDKAVKTTNNNRKQPRAWISGKRKLKQNNKQTDGQID